MNWIEERHSGQIGYRSACGTWYLGATPKKFYMVYRKGDNGWRRIAQGFTSAKMAQGYVDGIRHQERATA